MPGDGFEIDCAHGTRRVPAGHVSDAGGAEVLGRLLRGAGHGSDRSVHRRPKARSASSSTPRCACCRRRRRSRSRSCRCRSEPAALALVDELRARVRGDVARARSARHRRRRDRASRSPLSRDPARGWRRSRSTTSRCRPAPTLLLIVQLELPAGTTTATRLRRDRRRARRRTRRTPPLGTLLPACSRDHGVLRSTPRSRCPATRAAPRRCSRSARPRRPASTGASATPSGTIDARIDKTAGRHDRAVRSLRRDDGDLPRRLRAPRPRLRDLGPHLGRQRASQRDPAHRTTTSSPAARRFWSSAARPRGSAAVRSPSTASAAARSSRRCCGSSTATPAIDEMRAIKRALDPGLETRAGVMLSDPNGVRRAGSARTNRSQSASGSLLRRWPVMRRLLDGGDGTGPEAMSDATRALAPRTAGASVRAIGLSVLRRRLRPARLPSRRQARRRSKAIPRRRSPKAISARRARRRFELLTHPARATTREVPRAVRDRVAGRSISRRRST